MSERKPTVQCPICGTDGSVNRRIFPRYFTMLAGKEGFVGKTIIDECQVCGQRFFSAREIKRWERLLK